MKLIWRLCILGSFFILRADEIIHLRREHVAVSKTWVVIRVAKEKTQNRTERERVNQKTFMLL